MLFYSYWIVFMLSVSFISSNGSVSLIIFVFMQHFIFIISGCWNRNKSVDNDGRKMVFCWQRSNDYKILETSQQNIFLDHIKQSRLLIVTPLISLFREQAGVT